MDKKVYEGKCRRCGRGLTAEESVRRGYGSYCWSKVQRVTLAEWMKNEQKTNEEVICLWCGEPLIFEPSKGWVHKSDGKLYKTKIVDGEEIDDHCAMPKRV